MCLTIRRCRARLPGHSRAKCRYRLCTKCMRSKCLEVLDTETNEMDGNLDDESEEWPKQNASEPRNTMGSSVVTDCENAMKGDQILVIEHGEVIEAL